MTGRFLLDTSVAIALLRNEPTVRSAVGTAEQIILPSIAVGELFYGALISAKSEANRLLVENFVVGAVVLDCDRQTARYFAFIKMQLRAKGRPIPENDIWIAAVALQHQLTLVTRDAHFKEVEPLSIVKW